MRLLTIGIGVGIVVGGIGIRGNSILIPIESTRMMPTDIVIANILAGPLVQLAPKLSNYLEPGGKIALSGILSEQTESIVSTYSQWFDLEPVVHSEDWILVTGTKK